MIVGRHFEFNLQIKKTNTFHFENLPQLNRELQEIFFKKQQCFRSGR